VRGQRYSSVGVGKVQGEIKASVFTVGLEE